MSDLMLGVNNGVAQQTSSTTSSTKANGSSLDKDAFLQLLVCQMKYQDPLQPNTDTQYVAQLATFSQLEQMQNLNATNLQSQAFNLVGKSVIMKTSDSSGENNFVSGEVQYAKVTNGVAYVSINDKLYPISQLDSVVDDTTSNNDNSDAFSLVGQNVIMKSKDKEGKDVYVDGIVDYVTFDDGVAQLSINGTSYPINQLDKIIDSGYIDGLKSLVGKTVTVNSTDQSGSTKKVQGVVDAVAFKDGIANLSIGGSLYPINQLVSIETQQTTSA